MQFEPELLEPLCERLRVPTDCRDVARLVARFHGDMHRVAELRPETQLKILERCDALRRPERFRQLLQACQCDYNGRLGWQERAYDSPQRLLAALAAVNCVNAGEIAAACTDKARIPERIHAARVAAVRHLLKEARDEQDEGGED